MAYPYSLQWPQLKCDFFQISGTEGNGTGESLKGYPLKAGEYVIGDRGSVGGRVFTLRRHVELLHSVRLNTGSVKLQNGDRSPFPLLSRLGALKKAGESREWTVWVPSGGDAQPLRMRLCAVRKSVASTRRSLKKLYRKASINQRTPDPATLRYAEYVMVITTFPADKFSTTQVLHYYRFRWQIELLFKRLKQLAQLGHLPKHDEESSHAWLYGKLLIALLTDKLIAHARDFSHRASNSRRKSSRWREFSFMLHQVTMAITPSISLSNVISSWGKICSQLSESPRLRFLQAEHHRKTS
ncbi:MAG: transposase [Opitutaceae bacterium]